MMNRMRTTTILALALALSAASLLPRASLLALLVTLHSAFPLLAQDENTKKTLRSPLDVLADTVASASPLASVPHRLQSAQLVFLTLLQTFQAR